MIDEPGVLDLIPSHQDLINIDPDLAAYFSGRNLDQTKRRFVKIHGQLSLALKGLEGNAYDLVLIDCPPNFNIVTKSTLVESDYILIPSKEDGLSTDGIGHLRGQIKRLIQDYNFSVDSSRCEMFKRIEPQYFGGLFLQWFKFKKKWNLFKPIKII
jgi:chromosome partitioning protein